MLVNSPKTKKNYANFTDSAIYRHKRETNKIKILYLQTKHNGHEQSNKDINSNHTDNNSIILNDDGNNNRIFNIPSNYRLIAIPIPLRKGLARIPIRLYTLLVS